MLIIQLFTYSIGLTIGNFIWQAICVVPDWEIALDRSYFQAVALIGVLVVNRIWRVI